MVLSTPLALVLLVVIPYFVWLGWPRIPYRRRRDLSSLVIRLLLVLLIIFGLAGLRIVTAVGKLSVVFLVDASDSIDLAARDQEQTFIRQALSRMGSEDRAGIVVFGKNSLIERSVSSSRDFSEITSVPIRLYTDIAQAIRVGLAMFPADSAKRLVLLSDGNENLGSARQAAQLAAATGVQIDVVPFEHQPGPEVLVRDVRLPTMVSQGEVFDLGVTVQSTVDTPANLTVLAAGAAIQAQVVNLKPGDNNFVFTLKAPPPGFVNFDVRIDSPAGSDTFYQNNEMSGFTNVTGPPRILMVTSNPQEVAPLLPALQQSGVQVDVQGLTDLPIGLAPLAAYKAVVLANVSATDLSEQRMKVLQSYVRDLGGGLVAIGGPNSYGAGGYFQTPLEETLPVESRIKNQKRIPKLLIVYVIDRSGSMEVVEPGDTATRLELGKEAIRRSILFLQPQDRVGVVSYDTDPAWDVPIQPVSTNPQPLLARIGSLRPGGGDGTLMSMKEAMREAAPDPATVKHVIVLTDGDDATGDPVQFAKQMYNQYGVTVTAIDIESAVQPAMKDMAAAGHGLYYHLDSAQNLPQIFIQDAVFTSRSYIQEKEFTPTQSAHSPIMEGLASLPALEGYVVTTPKDTATVILKEPGFGDPLLASWQYGLGRVVAWTSDATTRWAKNWASWASFGRFWSQVIHWTINEDPDNLLDTHVEARGAQEALVVEARDPRGSFINGLSLNAGLVDPRLQSQSLKFYQIAPGRYEADFDPQTQGSYLIRVAGSDTSGNPAAAQTLGWVLSYSPEYRLYKPDVGLLNDLTQMTGGTTIAEQPELSFRHTQEAAQTAPAWPGLLLAATILLPIDIAIRRVIFTAHDWQKLQEWATQRLPQSRVSAGKATSARMRQLLNAKARARTVTTPAPSPEKMSPLAMPIFARRHRTATGEAKQVARQDQPVVTYSTVVKPPDAPPPSTMLAVDEESLASQLLDRRRKRDNH